MENVTYDGLRKRVAELEQAHMAQAQIAWHHYQRAEAAEALLPPLRRVAEEAYWSLIWTWQENNEISTIIRARLDEGRAIADEDVRKLLAERDALKDAIGDLLRCTEKHVFGDECKAQRDKARAILEQKK